MKGEIKMNKVKKGCECGEDCKVDDRKVGDANRVFVQELDKLRRALTNVEETHFILHERLKPLCREDNSPEPPCAKVEERNPMSQLSLNVEELRYRLDSLCSRIQNDTDMIEI